MEKWLRVCGVDHEWLTQWWCTSASLVVLAISGLQHICVMALGFDDGMGEVMG